MFRRLGVAVCLVVLFPAAHRLSAAEQPLEAVSSDAGIVVRLKAWSATLDKIKAFAGGVGSGVPEQVDMQAERVGRLISNPTLAGVDQAADWWLAVYPRPSGQEPQIVFLIPATDLPAMKKGVPEGMKFLEYGKYGIYTEDPDAADKTAARIKGDGKSIADLIEKESTAVFDRGDLSVFLNVTRLVTVYRDQVEQLKEQAQQGIEMLALGMPGGAGVNLGGAGGALTELVQVLSQGLNDTQSCTIAAMVGKEGLAFEDLIRVATDSQTDKLLQKSPPAALSILNSLPAAALGYLGFQADVSGLVQMGQQALAESQQADEESRKQLATLLDDMQKLKKGAAAVAFSLGDFEAGVLRTVSVAEVEDPAKFRELTNRLINAAGTVDSGIGVKQTSEVVENAEKFDEAPADVVKVTLEAGDQADPQASQMLQGYMQAIYGPEGMLTRHVYLKDKAVQTSGGGKEAMTAALAALTGKAPTTSGEATFRESREHLTEKANLMVLFDLPGTIGKALRLVSESGVFPLPIDPEAIAAMKLEPSFIGLSVGTEPQGLRVKTYVPTPQAAGVAAFVQMYVQISQLMNAAENVE